MINSYQNTFDSNKNLYSKFTDTNFLSTQNYSNNNSKPKIKYYNDEIEIKKKKTKKKFILGSVGLVFLGAISFAIGGKKFKFPSNFNTKNFKDIIENFGNNTNNIKDECIGRIIDFIDNKTPLKFIKKGFNKCSDWYRSNVHKSMRTKFEKAQKAILEAEGGDKLQDTLQNYEDVFNNLNQGITEAAQNGKLTTKELFKGDKGKIKNLWNNLIHPLSDAKIANTVKENANIIDIPEKASEPLKKAIENYNKIQQEELIPKLRDIAYGAAPSDIVTAAIPIGTFGVALAASDNKEERKSLLLNLGLPLFPTVTMPILGTIFPILNGIKAMVAGFAVGSIFSSGAKLIDNKLNKKTANEN